MKYPLVIFDWDGTLIDSEARIISSMQAAAVDAQWPEPLTDAAVRNIIGLGLPEAIQTLCPGVDDQQLQQIRIAYSKHFLETSDMEMPLFDGVREGLEKLRQAGYVLTVATGKSRRGLNQVFEETGLGELFVHSRCADETRSKPDPLMLHELLDETGYSVHQAVMVGDTEFDLGMAKNAGMDSVAVNYGAHHPDRLQAYKPVLAIDSFFELVDWLLEKSDR